jgi:hypothetical protein
MKMEKARRVTETVRREMTAEALRWRTTGAPISAKEL